MRVQTTFSPFAGHCALAVVIAVLLLAPTAAAAQVSRAQIEQAAATRLDARAAGVVACAPGMATLTVDVRFRGDGALSGVNLGPGAPETVTRCVASALAGVALPGAVPDGTTVRHVFHGAAAPPPQQPQPYQPPPQQPQPYQPPPQQPVIDPVPQQPVIDPVPQQPQAYPAQPPAYPTQPQAYPAQPQAYPAQPPAYQQPGQVQIVETVGPGAQTADSRRDEAETAEFSVGRYFVEVLVGGAAGAALSYGVYSAICGGGSDCFGAALAGLGANILITPLAIWGVGRGMGGRGDLLYTYIGGLTAFAGASAPDDGLLAIAIGTILMPFTAALLFEFTSHMMSGSIAAGLADRSHWQAGVSPIYGHAGIEGASLSLGGAF